MKKALLTVSTAVTGFAIALAQNGGVYNPGQTAQQGQVNASALIQLLNLARDIMNRLIPLMVTAAVLAFFFFLVRFIISGDPDGKNKSLKQMGYSVLALFVMVSIWGIVGLAGSLFGINQGGTIPVPGVPN